MAETYDIIIIGGGHNGLVAAATLAQAGKSVLVLERRKALGGAAATEEIFPGYRINTGADDAGLFSDKIIEKLNLTQYGLSFLESPAAAYAPLPDSKGLTIWRDVAKTQNEIRRFSEKDAVRLPEFVAQMSRFAIVWRKIMAMTPPDLNKVRVADISTLLVSGLKLKQLGKKEMMDFLRILPMSVREFLDDEFESDLLKGLLGGAGIYGSMLGPMAAGTFLTMLHHYTGGENGGFPSARRVKGGIGELSNCLRLAAEENSAKILTDTPVKQILIDGEDRATGVLLENGDTFSAAVVLSNANPRDTLFQLVGAPYLPLKVVRAAQNIRYKGVTAKLNLAINGLPKFAGLLGDITPLGGDIIICPDLLYLEKAYDAAKYGHFSMQPYLKMQIPTVLDASLAPERKHILNVAMQYAPYHLKEGNWKDPREALADCILKTLETYAPGIRNQIEHQQLITPLDWEQEYGLPEGNIFHGQMVLDQLFVMRPIPEYARYQSPIENLYFCGAGAHPGGGVTGLPGFNAAKAVLKRF